MKDLAWELYFWNVSSWCHWCSFTFSFADCSLFLHGFFFSPLFFFLVNFFPCCFLLQLICSVITEVMNKVEITKEWLFKSPPSFSNCHGSKVMVGTAGRGNRQYYGNDLNNFVAYLFIIGTLFYLRGTQVLLSCQS